MCCVNAKRDELHESFQIAPTLTYDTGNNTVGNLTSVSESGGSALSYGYDALYRLTSETRTGTNPFAHTYGYDPAGNRTSQDGGALTYDAGNNLLSFPGGGVAGNDADGNVVRVLGANVPTGSFSWDDLDNLTQQLSGNTRVNYAYDAQGHRVRSNKVVLLPGGAIQLGLKVFYVFDGDLLLGEVSALGSRGTVKAAYTWGAAGLVSEHLGGSVWYAFGPQGETRQLTDATGSVVESYVYTGYGVAGPVGNGTYTNPFRYGGQVGYYTDKDGLAGIVLCGARWYHPYLGRWLSRNPIRYEGGDNLYAYCDNDPINTIDPTGLKQQPGGFYDPQTSKAVSEWGASQSKWIIDSAHSWYNGFAIAADFVLGLGPDHYKYGPNNVETRQIQNCRAADQMRKVLRRIKYRSTKRRNGINTGTAFLNTILQLSNGTQAQLGGFEWKAFRKGNRMHIVVFNRIDVNSLMYHLPDYTGGFIPSQLKRPGGFGNIYQQFDWWEPVPPEFCKK